MKILYKYLAVVAMVILFAACHNDSVEQLPRDEALKVLDQKIKHDSKNADLYYQRGTLLISLGREEQLSSRFKEAIEDLIKATTLDDKKIEYFTALADAYYAIGDVGKSYSTLQKALQLDEKNIEANLKMAEIAYSSKNFERAMESLNIVTEQDKNNRTALFMKGRIYVGNDDTTNAVIHFRHLIELYPDFAPAYEELGMLYSGNGNKLGIEYLNTALRLEPTNINVLYALAQTYQDAEEADMANEYYVKMLEIDPQNKYAWFNRGRLELELYEDYEAAVDFFTKAIDSDPNFAEAHYNRGVSYEMMGDKNRAEACYITAKNLGFDKAENEKMKVKH